MNFEKSSLKSKAKADKFFDDLEQYLKRFIPESFIPKVSSFLINILDDITKWKYFPPHVLFSLLEADCAYYRPNYPHIEINEHWLKNLTNLYHGFQDPYIQYLLEEEKNLFLFLITLAKSQFLIQRKPNKNQFIRSISLIQNIETLKFTDKEIKKTYGFSLDDWALLCFSMIVLIYTNKSQIFYSENLTNTNIIGFPINSVNPFLKTICISPKDVKENFFELRSKYPSYLHLYLPSIFLDFPVVRFDNNSFRPLHPNLIMNKCYVGIHDLILNLSDPRLDSEFSRAFEMYVEKIFRIPNSKSILSENDIKKIIRGKNADLIIEFENSIFIVECKASRMSCKVATKKALLDDNITNKIANAFIQISHTAININQGMIDFFPKKKKNIIGLCIIFGEMEFANSDEYINNYVVQKMNPQDLEIYKNSNLSFNPQILSISSLEDLIMISERYHLDLGQIIIEKVQIPYEKYGDWPTYLLQLNKDNYDLSLPFEKDVLSNFHNGIINDKNIK